MTKAKNRARIHTIARSFNVQLCQNPSSTTDEIASFQYYNVNESLYSFARAWFMSSINSKKKQEEVIDLTIPKQMPSGIEHNTPNVNTSSNNESAARNNATPTVLSTPKLVSTPGAQSTPNSTPILSIPTNLNSNSISNNNTTLNSTKNGNTTNMTTPVSSSLQMTTPQGNTDINSLRESIQVLQKDVTPSSRMSEVGEINTDNSYDNVIQKYLKNNYVPLRYELPPITNGEQAMEQLISNQRRRSMTENLLNSIVHDFRHKRKLREDIARVRFEQARVCLCRRILYARNIM